MTCGERTGSLTDTQSVHKNQLCKPSATPSAHTRATHQNTMLPLMLDLITWK